MKCLSVWLCWARVWWLHHDSVIFCLFNAELSLLDCEINHKICCDHLWCGHQQITCLIQSWTWIDSKTWQICHDNTHQHQHKQHSSNQNWHLHRGASNKEIVLKIVNKNDKQARKIWTEVVKDIIDWWDDIEHKISVARFGIFLHLWQDEIDLTWITMIRSCPSMIDQCNLGSYGVRTVKLLYYLLCFLQF